MENKDTCLGRPVSKRVVIRTKGDFRSYYAAESLLESEGFSTGSMCSPEPTGFAPKDKYGYIAKWRNIPPSERKLLHGIIQPIEGGDFRSGPLEIVYFQDTI